MSLVVKRASEVILGIGSDHLSDEPCPIVAPIWNFRGLEIGNQKCLSFFAGWFGRAEPRGVSMVWESVGQ